MYRNGSYAIIVNENDELLIIQKHIYNLDEWTIIGGGKKTGESIKNGLIREIYEETGLVDNDLKIIGPSSFKIRYIYPKKVAKNVNGGKYIGQEYYQFIVKIKKSKKIICNEEIRKYKWVVFEDLEKYLIFPNQFESVKNAINELDYGLAK